MCFMRSPAKESQRFLQTPERSFAGTGVVPADYRAPATRNAPVRVVTTAVVTVPTRQPRLGFSAQPANRRELRGEQRQFPFHGRNFLLVRGVTPSLLGALERIGRLSFVE